MRLALAIINSIVTSLAATQALLLERFDDGIVNATSAPVRRALYLFERAEVG